MNECAAHERDAMLGRVRSALSAAPSTDLPTIRLAAALATVRAVRLGPYDERAVAGALWELGRALARAAVPRAGGART